MAIFHCSYPARARILAPLLLLLATLPGQRLYAHDFWIEPTAFSAAPGEEVSLILRVGQDLSGDRLPYINDWFSDYRVVSRAGAWSVEGLMGDDPAGSFVAREPGVHVVGYRSTRDFVELGPEKFRSYLVDEGLEHVIATRESRGEANAPAREYYSRCAKALIDVRGAADGVTHAKVLGYTLELIPERDPYRLAPGDELPLRLTYEGEPIAGILVQAFTAEHGARKFRARTDADGRVVLPLDRAGLWLVKAVHMIETPPDVTRADWESFWASLTFRLP